MSEFERQREGGKNNCKIKQELAEDGNWEIERKLISWYLPNINPTFLPILPCASIISFFPPFPLTAISLNIC